MAQTSATPIASPVPAGDVPVSGEAVPELADFDALMFATMPKWNLPGGQLAIARDERLVYNRAFGYASVEDGEVWILNVHINPYSHRGYADHEPTRKRKLLLKRQEIRKLIGRTVERGMTLVPTRMYFKNGHVKVAIGLAKGKQAHDKRETVKKREAERETRAAVKERIR